MKRHTKPKKKKLYVGFKISFITFTNGVSRRKKPLLNVAYPWLADFLEEMQHNNRDNSPQPLDHFPRMIGSPHNHWIIFPQWLDHLKTIGSFPNDEWITPQPLDHFPTLIKSATLPSFDKAKLKNNKKTKGRWVNLGQEISFVLIWYVGSFKWDTACFRKLFLWWTLI